MISKHLMRRKGNLKENKYISGVVYRATLFTAISNVFLSALKIVVGFLYSSVALIGDGFNNLSDTLSGVISIIGIKASLIPPDREHPFGHGRSEYISTFVVGIIIVFIGLNFGFYSVFEMSKEITFKYNSIYLITVVVSILIKLYSWFVNYRISKEVDSVVLRANVKDCFSDSLITMSILVSYVFSRFFNLYLDVIIGLLISLYIVYSGYKILKENISHLIGPAPNRTFVKQIHDDVCSYENVINVHDILVNNYGRGNQIVVLDVEIPYDMDLVDAHDLIEKIETDMDKKYHIHLIIHIDPVGNECGVLLETKKKLEKIISDNARIYSFHDLLEKEGKIHFDITVEGSIIDTVEKEEEIKQHVLDELGFECEIVVDKRYYI